MKQVVKGPEPSAFIEWKGHANPDWIPDYANLQNPEKRVVHEALLAEQGGVCCYCGRRIERADSHIEHFRPQEHFEALQLDYANLHASCLRETEPGRPLHCGHAKKSAFDEALAVSPLEAGCEARFRYGLGGQIYARDTQAEYMAALTNLDCSYLQRGREQALSIFDADFLDSATHQELRAICESFRQRDADGNLTTFGHVVARYAEQLLEPTGVPPEPR